MSFMDRDLGLHPGFLISAWSKLLNFAKNYFFFTTPHVDKINVVINAVRTPGTYVVNMWLQRSND